MLNTTVKEEITSSYFTRTDMGVVVQYEFFTNKHAFLTELWRGAVSHCSCKIAGCQHGRLALLLEEQYQEAHRPHDLGSCLYCGRLARVVRGVAICSACAS